MTAEAPSLIDHMPDDVTERLRSDIVLGALRPGEWLRQIDLQDRYNCTRSAARTALATLANAHIVEHTPNPRGAALDRGARGNHRRAFDVGIARRGRDRGQCQ